MVIDAWNAESGRRCHTAEIELEAGQKTDIRVDYANAIGEGFIRMEWEAEGLTREVIPESQLSNSVDTTAQTGVKTESFTGPDIRVFPNPADAELFINCPGEGFCTIYAQNGEKMDAFRITERLTRRNTSRWSPGVYFLHINTGDHEIIRRVIVS